MYVYSHSTQNTFQLRLLQCKDLCLQNTMWIHGIQFYFAMEKGKGADIYLGYM